MDFKLFESIQIGGFSTDGSVIIYIDGKDIVILQIQFIMIIGKELQNINLFLF